MAKKALTVSPIPKSARSSFRRPDPTRRGYKGPWRRYSEGYRKLHPVCLACVEVHTPVYCVDHIIPMNGPDDEFVMAHWNHEPLCRACHFQKTHGGADDRLAPIRTTLCLGLRELELEHGTTAARNELLQRAGIWPQWFDLETYEVVRLAVTPH